MATTKSNGLTAPHSQPAETSQERLDSMTQSSPVARRIWSSVQAKFRSIWYASLWWTYLSPRIVSDDPHARLAAHFRDRAREAAVTELLKPIEGRERCFYPCTDSAMLLDDGGGACITLFEDWEACHFFLLWLHAKRAQRMSGGEA